MSSINVNHFSAKVKMEAAKLAEGKTKIVQAIPDNHYVVRLLSKNDISAHNAMYVHNLEGKGAIANKTTCCIFQFLSKAGIATHFVKQESDSAFLARKCEMIPIEFVARRLATGSFLKRNAGVQEGYRFAPLKIEYFFKDDAKGDPEWSYAQIIETKFTPSQRLIGAVELDQLTRATNDVFEILERLWFSLGCSLIDMKIEFGVDAETKEILLADVIDNDSWRIWPNGDKRLMKDKQVYRDIAAHANAEQLQAVIKNYEWVLGQLSTVCPQPRGRIVVIMGSGSDRADCGDVIRKEVAKQLGVHCELRIMSAHKATEQTLKLLAQYEADAVAIPTVIIAVAGRSNGLGPVLGSNTWLPVINCPPVKGDFATADVWSSLRLPYGVGCSTVITPDAAVAAAGNILSLHDVFVFARVKANQFNRWVAILNDDVSLQSAAAGSV